MSTTLGLGVPVPKMLRRRISTPCTENLLPTVTNHTSLAILGTWALPFTAYYMFLSGRVVATRLQNRTYFGNQIPEEKRDADRGTAPDPLHVNSRCFENFVEYVPLAFILAGVAELNGANRTVLNYAMGVLLALRVMHVELGMKVRNTIGLGRPAGYYGTMAWLGWAAAYSTYLVKGYWGY